MTIMLLGAGSILVFVADSFRKLVDKDEAETSIIRAAYSLRVIATQAVNLFTVAPGAGFDSIGPAGSGAAALATQGLIVDSVNTEAGALATAESRVVEIAVFYREGSKSGNSVFLPTGIFFKTPYPRCAPNITNATDATYGGTRENCSGQLIIVTNNSGGANVGTFTAADGGGRQLYSPSGFLHDVFDRLVSISVTTTSVTGAAGGPARDTTFNLKARYFLAGNPANYNYLPAVPNVSSKEITMEVHVGFRNNYLGNSQLVSNEAERLHQSLYYFPFSSTLRGI